ncbi:hypothetical protein Pelo_5889 [Pelomyxa schiedti]|nr:hypothetical protein Pelo_5889 [Pelomyxa schiedti]
MAATRARTIQETEVTRARETIELSTLDVEFCSGSVDSFILRVTEHARRRSSWHLQIDNRSSSTLTNGRISDAKNFEQYLKDTLTDPSTRAFRIPDGTLQLIFPLRLPYGRPDSTVIDLPCTQWSLETLSQLVLEMSEQLWTLKRLLIPALEPFIKRGFQPLLFLDGNDMGFSADPWTSTVSPTGSSRKYMEYNTKIVTQLALIDPASQRFTVLALPSPQTALAFFSDRATVSLNVVDGCLSPLQLIYGTDEGRITQPTWRKNSVSGDVRTGMCVRLGGWFHFQWGDTYKQDSQGNKCSAEVVGIGLRDTVYAPYCEARSSGIRQAHNYTNFHDVGQMALPLYLFGV